MFRQVTSGTSLFSAGLGVNSMIRLNGLRYIFEPLADVSDAEGRDRYVLSSNPRLYYTSFGCISDNSNGCTCCQYRGAITTDAFLKVSTVSSSYPTPRILYEQARLCTVRLLSKHCTVMMRKCSLKEVCTSLGSTECKVAGSALPNRHSCTFALLVLALVHGRLISHTEGDVLGQAVVRLATPVVFLAECRSLQAFLRRITTQRNINQSSSLREKAVRPPGRNVARGGA